MFDFHKPQWLYEALPYVYVVGGVATIANLGSALSMLSGGLLISAGLFISWMRRSYRLDQRRREADRRTAERRTTDRRVAAGGEVDRTEIDRRKAERRDRLRRETKRRNR